MADHRNPYQLDPAENERIFREKILPDILDKNPTLRPSDAPTMLVVGGQPGAGKTNSIKGIEADFAGRGGVLVVDLDALRENHTAYNQLMRADDKVAAQYTYDDARIWAQKLEDYAKINRYNVLVESLMTSPDGVGGWLQDYRQAGYTTEAHVVAVNERASLQGIVKRYEEQKVESADNAGRTVPREVHNLAYDRVRDTFDRIEADKLSDRVVVHNRDGAIVYDNRLQPGGQWDHAPGGARTAVEAERSRSLSPTQWRDHILAYDEIQAHQRRPERGATQADLDEVRQLRTASVREGGLTAQAGLHPVLSRSAVGAGVLATAYDAAVSGREAWGLHQQGNATGAESEVVRFGARNVGAWGGALVGAKVGTLAGVESGPGMLVTGIVGAGIGAWGAERVVDWTEQNSINTQVDRHGIEWRFDPEHSEKGWQRDVVDAFAERGLSLKHKETAPADVADELNYKASVKAVELRLSSPDIAVNPYEIPADASDVRSLRESPWIRNPDTGAWRREVADGMIDRVMHTYTEVAPTDKAAELDAYAQSVIAYNAARSPAAVAAHFESVYRNNGWETHGDGELPAAVRTARADLQTLVASDGDRYRRDQNGEWTSVGIFYDSTARGNLHDELEATHQALQARLQPPQAALTTPEPQHGLDPHAIPQATPEQRDVREQAQREANRQGLSQDQAQRFVQGAAATIAMDSTPAVRSADTEGLARQEDAAPARQAPSSQQTEPPPPTRDPREDEAREREQAQHARTDAPAPLPPDFAPSRQQAPDLRDTSHAGHDAFREMRHKVSLYEARQGIPHGEHTDRVAAALLQTAVENGIPYDKAQLVKDPATGQTHLLDRRDPSQSENQCPRVAVDVMRMSSQPIDASSRRLDETVSRNNAVPAQAQERTQQQSQALAALSFDDQVMFARIRRDVPGHVSDEHVGLAMKNAKQEGMRDAGSIGAVMMIGDQLYVRGQGEWAKDLTVDVTKTAPTMQASVEATNTLNEQRAPQLAQKQDNSTQDDPGPKGPRLA